MGRNSYTLAAQGAHVNLIIFSRCWTTDSGFLSWKRAKNPIFTQNKKKPTHFSKEFASHKIFKFFRNSILLTAGSTTIFLAFIIEVISHSENSNSWRTIFSVLLAIETEYFVFIAIITQQHRVTQNSTIEQKLIRLACLFVKVECI